MGYMCHHAIVVTSYDRDLLEIAREKAIEFGNIVTPIVDAAINGEATFVVVPDGSKEGWDRSDEGDAARAALVTWMRGEVYEDGSSSLRWVEVLFGDDERQCYVVQHGDDQR